MPRQIEKTLSRIPLKGGALFKYSPYMTTWKLDYSINGERKRVTLVKDQRESLRKANELLEEKAKIESGRQARPAAEVTLREVADAYLAMRRTKLAPKFAASPRTEKSFRIDEDRLNKILDRLPVTKVAELRKAACTKFVDQYMSEPCLTNSKKTHSRSTSNKFVKELMQALRYAASIDLCLNPLEGLKLRQPAEWEIRKNRRAMTNEEYQKFLAASVERDVRLQKTNADRVPQTPNFLAIYEAGRRREEIQLLEWPAVHLDGDFPTWEFFETKGSKLAKKTSGKGAERYAIPPRLVKYLRSLKELHERKLGRKVRPSDRVFLGPQGRPIHGENFLRAFYAILEAADVPRQDHRGRTLDLHAARTTVYARGAEAGIPVDQMMTFVGHKDIRTAMKHYHDPNCVKTQGIAAKLAEIAEGTNGKSTAQNGNGAESQGMAIPNDNDGNV